MHERTGGRKAEGASVAGVSPQHRFPPRRLRRWQAWVLGIVLASCVLLAGVCELGSAGLLPGGRAPDSAFQTPRPGDIVLQETFDGAYHWRTGGLSGGSATLNSGRLSIHTWKTGTVMSPFESLYERYDGEMRERAINVTWLLANNVDLTLATTVENDVGGAWFGAACRYVGDNFYYGFLVGSDGTYRIIKRGKDAEVILAEGSSNAIQQGPALNQLRVVCDGDRLMLAVNNTRVAEASDAELTTGIIALIGGAMRGAYPDTVVSFDTFIIRAP